MDSQRDSRDPVDVTQAFRAIDEHWRPRVAAELNGQELKLVKFQGEIVWHHHVDADELFLVWRGQMRIEYRDRVVTLDAGQFAVVPRGIEHRTTADGEVEVLIFESANVRNTGDVIDARLTAPRSVL